MDPTKETIACTKGEEKKFFSQRQLDMIGKNADGTYDGWAPKPGKPVGIPEPVVIATPTDPNGGIEVSFQTPDTTPAPVVIDATPVVSPDANVVAPVAPVVDETNPVEKVEKGDKPKTPAKEAPKTSEVKPE